MATAKGEPVRLDANQVAVVVAALGIHQNVYARAAKAEPDPEIAAMKQRQADRCAHVASLVRDGALL